MELGLNEKVALVTGSHRGTGAGIAGALAREGARVLVHGHEAGQADATVRPLRAAGLDVHGVAGDLTSDAGADEVVAQAFEVAGRVDVLVNNYGVAEGGGWLETSTDEWISIYQKNVLAGVRLVRSFAPAMRERGWGRIIWLGTIGAHRPGARMPHYYASKAVLPNVCTSLAQELEGSGVTVNLVSPGLIATAEVVTHFERCGEAPDGVASVEDVAAVVVFLASERAAAVNAANLRVDCGRSRLAL